MDRTKRLLLAACATLVLILVFSGTALAAAPGAIAPKSFDPQPEPPGIISIFLNGDELDSDVEPMIINDRAFMPMRIIFEAMGADVTWDGIEQSVFARRGEMTIQLWIGKTNALVNGLAVPLDAAPVIFAGRTMVPARFIGESFGYKVNWDGARRMVDINSADDDGLADGLGSEVEWDDGIEPGSISSIIKQPAVQKIRSYTLTMRAEPAALQENEVVTFDGYLTYTTALSNIPNGADDSGITIYKVTETDTGALQAVLGTAMTDSQGYYYFKLAPSETAAYFAVYENGSGQELARSSQYTVTVEKKIFTPIRTDIIKSLNN